MIIQSLITGHRSAIRHRPPALGPRRVSVIVEGTVVGVVAVWGPAAASPATPSDRGPNAHGYVQTNLVSDQPGVAALTDPNLVNPWGLSEGPTTPIWVSGNGADVATLYSGDTAGLMVKAAPLVVSIPDGAPTGQVFNDTTSFVLPDGAPARFLFASEAGTLTGWNPQLQPITSAVTVATSPDAVYKGLALLHTNGSAMLLAADFHHGRIDVFDPMTGHFLGTVKDQWGHAIRIDGLWGLLPGNGVASDPAAVWFSAGPNHEQNGLLGTLRLATSG